MDKFAQEIKINEDRLQSQVDNLQNIIYTNFSDEGGSFEVTQEATTRLTPRVEYLDGETEQLSESLENSAVKP